MRGAPQSGLARLIWRISRRISGVMLGLPDADAISSARRSESQLGPSGERSPA